MAVGAESNSREALDGKKAFCHLRMMLQKKYGSNAENQRTLTVGERITVRLVVQFNKIGFDQKRKYVVISM